MKATVLVYLPDSADPVRHELTEPPELGFWQAAVGGWIEFVPNLTTIELGGAIVPCAAFCNEEGKLQSLPINHPATVLWDRALRRVKDEAGARLYPNGIFGADGRVVDVLMGPIAVVCGDDEFMAEL